jgi:hypothetical protein
MPRLLPMTNITPEHFSCRKFVMRHDMGYFEEQALGKSYDIKLLKRLYPFAKPYKLIIFV